MVLALLVRSLHPHLLLSARPNAVLFLSGDEDKAMQRARLHMGLRTVQRRVLQQQHIELPIELNKNTRFWDVRNHYEAIPRARAVHR